MGAEYVGRGKADGLIIGRASGNGAKIGFFGTTPVALQTASTAVGTASAITGSTTTWGFATSTQADAMVTAINSIITNAAAYGADL
jgi:UDP-N-acetyl-D-mannosaminuronic acid transferase (WecB/TagA/CpsF family)